MLSLADDDPEIATWWGSRVECISAVARRIREGILAGEPVDTARSYLDALSEGWFEVDAGSRLRTQAERLLLIHPLRAADALQLAAALVWSQGEPTGSVFVCLDDRLRSAARSEGFEVLPAPGV
jgi:uncharacterized protein